ncbi:MAG: response regulator [Candidatus Eisenbacteria bacterium]|uniref:Response regulator n=1 Tax=Eiseniibacteriota bacterium TaxID=2212470 RepID=A0A956RP87_UNCEI|nr:response regulator [Candidatus Eisenbacteria bacterium]
MIRTLLVDDELPGREGLRLRLAHEPDIEIVGEAADGSEAVALTRSFEPDLLFLDIQMPGTDGFQVLDAIAGEHLPMVIFVTAHDEHAVRAFEVGAVDYLLKPVGMDRLRQALERVRHATARDRRWQQGERVAALLDSLETGPQASSYLRRFAIREGDRYRLLAANDVDWIQGAGNYLELHAGSRTALVRMTIREVEGRLDPERFVRIHRSTIVNVESIREIVPEWHGDSEVVLRSGQVVRMSRTYRHRLFPRDDAER